MNNSYPKFNRKLKNREDIPILKDIPVCMIDKYWIDVINEYQEEVLQIGYEIRDDIGNLVATVIDAKDDKALIQLIKEINYFEAIEFGIDMDKIVFDLPQTWIKCGEVDTTQQIFVG